MSVHVLSIDPDGTVTALNGDPMVMARAEFNDLTTVVTLHHPLTGFGEGRICVGWIHDFGAVIPLPVNRKAWILYGGSPIYGTMFVAADDRGPLDEEFVRVLLSDEDWIGPEFNAAMDDWLSKLEAHK